jgi:hypothetical protein
MDLKLERDSTLDVEWPFGDNRVIAIYGIRRAPELLIGQVQQRYFCFEVIAFRFVEKGQILFVLSRNPHIAIVAVENHAGDGFPEDHAKRPVIGRNLIFSQNAQPSG